MSVILLEAPRGAARRVWLLRPGRAPILIPPLSMHRRRFGPTYSWGDRSRGAHLTAATMLWLAGMPGPLAAYHADLFVSEWLMDQSADTVRVGLGRVQAVALHYIVDRSKELADKLTSLGRDRHA